MALRLDEAGEFVDCEVPRTLKADLEQVNTKLKPSSSAGIKVEFVLFGLIYMQGSPPQRVGKIL